VANAQRTKDKMEKLCRVKVVTESLPGAGNDLFILRLPEELCQTVQSTNQI